MPSFRQRACTMLARSVLLLALATPAAAVERRWAHQLGHRWRALTSSTPAAASIDHEWRDDSGACAIEFAVCNEPQLKINLTGFGSAGIGRPATEALGHAIARARADAGSVDALVDMTDASAASTSCIFACRRFLLRHGTALGRVAVVGKGPQLFFMRVCTRLARFRKVRVFGSQAAADRWLLEA